MPRPFPDGVFTIVDLRCMDGAFAIAGNDVVLYFAFMIKMEFSKLIKIEMPLIK